MLENRRNIFLFQQTVIWESVFRLTVWLHKDPGTHCFLNSETQWFWTGTHDFSQDESQDSLTITICNKITANTKKTAAKVDL